MKTIIVDGLSGSGKWVISRAICCLKDVNSISIDENLENIINANTISPNIFFPELLVQYLKVFNYNKNIGRHFNVRENEFTSGQIFPFDSIKEVSKRDEGLGSFLVNKINIVMVHGGGLIGLSDFLVDLKEVLFIKVKRNPLDFIVRWNSYIDRYGKDITETTLCYKYGKFQIPWFIRGFEELYLESNTSLEKVIVALTSIQEKNLKASEKVKGNFNFIEIPFEKFVLQPILFLEKICEIIEGGKINFNIFDKLAKELKIPRQKKIEEFGYWKPQEEFDFEEQIQQVSKQHKKLFEQILQSHKEGNSL